MAEENVKNQLQFLRGKLENENIKNHSLLEGQPFYSKDTNQFFIGELDENGNEKSIGDLIAVNDPQKIKFTKDIYTTYKIGAINGTPSNRQKLFKEGETLAEAFNRIYDVDYIEDVNNYVNLTDDQEIGGQKSFSNPVAINGTKYSNNGIIPSSIDYKLNFPTTITKDETIATQEWVQDNVNLSYTPTLADISKILSTNDIRLLGGDNGVFKATLTPPERSFLPTSENFMYAGFNFSSGDTMFPLGYSLNKVDIELKSNATGSTNVELYSGIYHKNHRIIKPNRKGAIYFRFTFKSDIATSDEFQITANTYEFELSDNLNINSFSDLGGLVNIVSTHSVYTPSSITYNSDPFELKFSNNDEGSFDLSYFVEGNPGVTLTNNSFNRRAFWL